MKISLVVPVYNEEATIENFYSAVKNFDFQCVCEIEIIFIDDGSEDNTIAIIIALAQQDSLVKFISFSRNFGKESALMAGIEYATGDAVIPIDVDLQDPLEAIPIMICKWRAGADIVLAKRIDRSSDNFFKKNTALMFYRLHNKISHPKIEENVGDFRLIDRKYVNFIKQMPEYNLFMKGVLSWVGGKVEVVEYTRQPRVAGKGKFNGWKLWNLALDGIINFSTIPLRVWAYLGFTIASLAFFYGSYMVLQTLIWGNPVRGYPSLLVSILFIGGIQLIGIGILGEYIGRLYAEVKNRPRYIVDSHNFDKKQ